MSCKNDEWGDADFCIYKVVISDIVSEYEKLGYSPSVNKPVTILHSPFGYPMCSNVGDSRIIFLATKDNYWSQLAYQFAHEYCHHLVDGPMDGENCSSFWFEESVCELSSIYFMRRIAQRWVADNTPFLNEYAGSVLSYCESNWACVPQVDSLSSWIATNMGVFLESDYHRDMYKVIAKNLYPLFEKHPDMWKLLPYMKRVTQEVYRSFDHWIACVIEPTIPQELLHGFNLLKENVIESHQSD